MQYDVYLNPSPQSKNIYPYVVDVQSDLLSFLKLEWLFHLRVMQGILVNIGNKTLPKTGDEMLINNADVVFIDWLT